MYHLHTISDGDKIHITFIAKHFKIDNFHLFLCIPHRVSRPPCWTLIANIGAESSSGGNYYYFCYYYCNTNISNIIYF